MSHYTYELKNSLYINLTNRCNNICTFCIKFKNRKFEGAHDLWLTKEPTAEQVLSSVDTSKTYDQAVFCGYGEPLIRLELLKQVAKLLKEKGLYIRIDTDGQANLFHGRNIIPELAGLIDEINISLNAQDSETYQKLCRPVFGKKAHSAIIDFAKAAQGIIPKVILTAVDLPTVDKEKCKQIADELGVEFKVRPYYEENYVS